MLDKSSLHVKNIEVWLKMALHRLSAEDECNQKDEISC